MKLLAYVIRENQVTIRPAPLERDWMDGTPEHYAYRCLPLNIANAHGWEVLCPSGFSAIWNGGGNKEDITIAPDGAETCPATSHFGSGILTFQLGCLFRTDSEFDLMAQGPINRPKDAIAPLTGVIETDWVPFTFTMNYRFTRPATPIRFEKGEPFCHIFPIRRGDLDLVTPELHHISEVPELKEEYEAWLAKRLQFNADVQVPGSPAHTQKWQKFYHTGKDSSGRPSSAESHRTKIRLRPFIDRRGG
jgi:hypothetical protein